MTNNYGSMTETNSFILTMDGRVTESFKTTVLSSPYLATATTSKASMALTIGFHLARKR